MPPLVSVIIPTYNRWPMVGEAVDSVLRQTHGSFEIIVVDDGSTDDTATALARRDFRVRVLSQARRGVAAARNAGARQAKGKYLAFLDSDDLWLPKKLELQMAFMQRNRGVAICQTEEIWLRRGVRVNPKIKHRKPGGDIFRRCLALCIVSPSAVIMSNEFFDRLGGFDETFPVCEDYELWLRVAVEQPVALIETPLVVKRGGHADQLSRSMWGMDRFRIAAIRKLLRQGLDREKHQWAVEALTQKIAIVAEGARKRGREDDAKAYEAMLSEFCEESIGHVGRSDSRIRGEQRISPANP
jgi:glycosyltransferase involved in cell wall biosynthesis